MNTSGTLSTNFGVVSPLENRRIALALSLLTPLLSLTHIAWQLVAQPRGGAVLLVHVGILFLGAMAASSITLSSLSLDPRRRLELRQGVRLLIGTGVLLSLSFATTWTMATSNMAASALV